MNTKEKQFREYLEKKVNYLIKPMIVSILKTQPENVVDHIEKWCENEGREIEINYKEYQKKPLKEEKPIEIKNEINEKEIEQIEKNINKLNQESRQELLDKKSSQSFEKISDKNSLTSSKRESKISLDEEEDVVDMEEIKRKKQKQKKKMGISAEAYGKYNKLGDFKARVIKKTEIQKQLISEILSKSFMFDNLEKKDQEVVIDAMEIKDFKQDDVVIKQGDDGEELFIVAEGELKCTKIFSDQTEETFLKNYYPGEVFGELSLLYNTPRAASIYALKESQLFSLDRDTFNHIVKTAAIKKREKYETFLSKIEIFKSLDPYEKGKLCDCLQTKVYKKGEFIIKEGDAGDTFYLIQEGEAVATKRDGEEEQIVFEYKANGDIDYFGELALLNGDKRKANIKVTSEEMTVAYLTKKIFDRLLGPIHEILKRNEQLYEKFKKQQIQKNQILIF